MTAQEAMTAYLNYCATNKGRRVTWREAGVNKGFECVLIETAVAKILEVDPVAEDGYPIAIVRIDITPTWEGYVEWLSFQP